LYRTEVVSLEYRVNKAFEGKYFMGHTPMMALRGQNAWGGLVNPKGSGTDLFINTVTVSNFSDAPFQAELWVNTPPDRALISPFVSQSNTAKMPREPKAQLVYQPGAGSAPMIGMSLFSRVAQAHDTVVGNYYGKIVIPPGGSFLVFLYAPKGEADTEVALGWWEDMATRSY
jgi:hypothetical protein